MPPPWATTDDTEMAQALVEVLIEHGRVDPDRLADRFAARYRRRPARGYGAGAHGLLSALLAGASWQDEAPRMFGGQGSLGNGAAMRVAPLGGFFAPDLARVVVEARASAEPTHAHPEGQAGAIAVAVAAAGAAMGRRDLVHLALEHTPAGQTAEGLERAAVLAPDCAVATAARLLGTGQRISAMDTVPFALWCAERHLDDYSGALWATVSGLGDRDTTCAIVGGIVALAVGPAGLPSAWLAARESLVATEDLH